MPPSAQDSAAEGEVQSIFRGLVNPEVPPKIPCLVFYATDLCTVRERNALFGKQKLRGFERRQEVLTVEIESHLGKPELRIVGRLWFPGLLQYN